MLSAGVKGNSFNIGITQDNLLSRIVNQPNRKKSLKQWRKRFSNKLSK